MYFWSGVKLGQTVYVCLFFEDWRFAWSSLSLLYNFKHSSLSVICHACLKVCLTFPFLSPFTPFPILLVFSPSHLIPLSNLLCFWKSFLSQKLPETFEDGGQQEGEDPEWVMCANFVIFFFNADMWTCHCLTIIHGVRWIIFRGHRCFSHLVTRMKPMRLSDIQLAMWISFWIPCLSLIKKC